MQHASAKTYLALGDSYTIGEAVPLHESFPYQTVQLLRNAGLPFHAPEIIAKTGWTTHELLQVMNPYMFQPQYNLVTVLIGVNNQYRGLPIEEYIVQFENILQQAIRLSGSGTNSVVVLSIPDWSVTPFAADRNNRTQIATEIDAFNSANETIANRYKTHYINITPHTRLAASDERLLATDKLHPSAKAYGQWAQQLAEKVLQLA